jgi:maleylpyruvate isomerase
MAAADRDMSTINRLVGGIARAQTTLLTRVASLTDAQARQPCFLPDWSVGHLLTHIARNGDSLVRRFEGALRNEVADQYEGGAEGREADIQAGAGRSADELVDDIRQSSADVDEICARMSPEAWSRPTRSVTGTITPASYVALSRWREVEVHHVDLGLGYTPADWPPDLIEVCLPGVLDSLVRRTDQAQLMAWAMNRAPAPEVASWG